MHIWPYSMTHKWPYSRFVCFLYSFIDRLENLHADLMFQSTAEAKGEDSDPVKHVSAPSYVLLTVQMRYFCCGSSVYHVVSVCIWSSAI